MRPMIWRLLSAAAGLPLGWLAGLAWLPAPTAGGLQVAALVGAFGMAACVSAIERFLAIDGSRGMHLARGAAVATAALPAALLAHWGLGPGPAWSTGGIVGLVAVALFTASRVSGPCSWNRYAAWLLASLFGGTLAFVAVAMAFAAMSAEPAVDFTRRAPSIYDMDAQVETRELPGCPQRASQVRELGVAGAHPQLGQEGNTVWFDAVSDEGRRQIYRLDLESGDTLCWTCGQPGNNRHPAVGPTNRILLFDSDRDATPSQPDNTEIYQTTSQGDAPPGASRRLTFGVGPDERPVLGPSPTVIVWSRRHEGRYYVASASILTGHGGVLLRDPAVVVPGGSHWAAPAGWSRDARTLLTVRGNPFRPLELVALDPATDETKVMWPEASSEAKVGLSADGGWLAVAGTQRASALGLLPDALGALLGRFANSGVAARGTSVATGPVDGPLVEVDLGEHAIWGAPTGVSLSPDGTRMVVGQRDGDAERILAVELSCVSHEAHVPVTRDAVAYR